MKNAHCFNKRVLYFLMAATCCLHVSSYALIAMEDRPSYALVALGTGAIQAKVATEDGHQPVASEQKPLAEMLVNNLSPERVAQVHVAGQPATKLPDDTAHQVNAQLDELKKHFEDTIKQLSQEVSGAPTSEQKDKGKKEGDDSFATMLNIFAHLDDANTLKNATETHGKMLSRLPADLKKKVEETCALYGEMNKSLRITWCLTTLCQALIKDLGALADSSDEKKGYIEAIRTLQVAVRSGVFMDLVAPQAPSMQSVLHNVLGTLFGNNEAIEPKQRFTRKDLHALCATCESLRTYCKKPEFAKQCPGITSQADVLCSLLVHAEQGEAKELCSECINLLKPAFECVLAKIKDTCWALAHVREQLPAADQKIIDYWIAYLDNNLQTMYAFENLTWKAQWDFSPMLCFMSNAYEVLEAFFVARRVDLFGVSNTLDVALRVAIVGMAFSHQYSQASAQAVQEYLKGAKSLQGSLNLPGFGDNQAPTIDPFGPFLNKIGLFVTTIQLVFNPAVFGNDMSLLEKTLWRLSVALGVHYAKHGTDALWSNNDPLIRIALMAAIKDVQLALTTNLKYSIEDNVDPVVLENLETYSMGLIKPELLCETLRVAMLMLVLKGSSITDKVVKFDADDIFCYNWLFSWLMHKNYVDYYKRVGGQNAIPMEEYLKQNAGFFVEYLLMRYALSNVGEFWGRIAGRACQDQITNGVGYVAEGFLGGTVNTLNTVADVVDGGGLTALFSPQGANKTKRTTYEQFRRIIVSLFKTNAMPRMLMISWLKNRGLIDNDMTDQQEINYAIIRQLLYHLVKYKLLSHNQSADLVTLYRHDQKNISGFVDALMAGVKESFASAVGGMGGYYAGLGLAEAIMLFHGPIFVKEQTAPAKA